MYRDDYIMRMIRQFGQVLTYALGLRQRREYVLALIATDNAVRDLLGVGSDAISQRSDGEILALLRFRDRNGTWREEGAYLAALLHAEAVIYSERDEGARAAPRALRALQILVECALAGPDPLPDFAPSVVELLTMLRATPIPDRTRAALFQLHEQEGDFARAEDQLFHLLDQRPADRDLRAAGLAFYQRLLALDDDALIAAGLPRAEILAGLADLQSR